MALQSLEQRGRIFLSFKIKVAKSALEIPKPSLLPQYTERAMAEPALRSSAVHRGHGGAIHRSMRPLSSSLSLQSFAITAVGNRPQLISVSLASKLLLKSVCHNK